MFIFLVVLMFALPIIPALFCLWEASRQGRSKLGWFFLGLFFRLNAFLALKLAEITENERHGRDLWTVLALFFGISVFFVFFTGLNAERKGYDFNSWAIFGFFAGMIGWVVSFFLGARVEPIVKSFRQETKYPFYNKNKVEYKNTPDQKYWICKKCGCKNLMGKMTCRDCGEYK